MLSWTGEWIISLSKNASAKSIYEKDQENKSMQLAEFKKAKLCKIFRQLFLMQN